MRGVRALGLGCDEGKRRIAVMDLIIGGVGVLGLVMYGVMILYLGATG